MKKKIKKEVKKDISQEVIEQAKILIKERNIKRVAHRPNGKVTWLHLQGLEDDLRNAISSYLTIQNNMTIHQLGELALCKFLKVKARVQEK